MLSLLTVDDVVVDSSERLRDCDMFENQYDNRDRDIGCNCREELRVHVRSTSMLKAPWYTTEDLELRHLDIVLSIMKAFDVFVGKPADHNV